MSDNTEPPPPSLVAALRLRAYGALAFKDPASSNIYDKAADIAERHESRWQADRAALVARAEAAEKRLADLLATCSRACNDARQVLPPLGMHLVDDDKAIGWLRRIEQNIEAIEKGATDE